MSNNDFQVEGIKPEGEITRLHITALYESLLSSVTNAVAKQNLISKLKTTHACLNCGSKKTQDSDVGMLELSSNPDDLKFKLNVTLRVLYICDFDQYKLYEIKLRAGEYSFQEIMHKIKERVSFDRYLVKLSKRMFVLTDLVFDSTLFAQVFTNEQMKFCFKAD